MFEQIEPLESNTDLKLIFCCGVRPKIKRMLSGMRFSCICKCQKCDNFATGGGYFGPDAEKECFEKWNSGRINEGGVNGKKTKS